MASTDWGQTAQSGVTSAVTPASNLTSSPSSAQAFSEHTPSSTITNADASDIGQTAQAIYYGAVPIDLTPPTFAGVVSVSSVTLDSALLSWAAATDDVTPQGGIVYEVCYATTLSGATTSFAPQLASAAGATSVTVGGLTSGTLYYFCVRARDGAGNRDANTATVTATTLAPDTTAPTFAGVTSVGSPTLDTLTVHWSAGTDAVTAQGSLVYDVAIATSSGGCSGANFASALAATSLPGATSVVVAGLATGTTYYACVRARDAAGNRDTNNVTASATTLAPDTTAPTFAGITSLNTPTLTTLTAHWSAASDSVSSPSNISYDVCWATSSIGCTGGNFTALASSPPGATSIVIPGLASATTYFVCVRARDQAGNEDTNNVTASATTSAPTPPDTTPPSFAGITGLISPTRETLTATWAAATDSVTAQNALEYDACWGTSSGAVTGGNFTRMVTSTPGATSVVIPGLAAGTLYYVCVRARDAAGNEDTNNVTASATTAIADVTSPTIGNYVPALSSTIAATDSIQFDVLDNASMRSVVIAARYQTNTGELVHDGSQFLWPFTLSTRTIISGGYRYVLTRTGGWQAPPSIQVFAIDTSGNENA
jgi:heme/copper-type cytochrome/quinol oxidase subunit 2